MKSKISLFNKAVFKHNLTGGWYLWALFLLFYILVLPVSVYGSLSDAIRYEAGMGELRDLMIRKLWDGYFAPYIAIVALCCAMFVFSYLFTPRNSNMMHTYPVSRRSLFLTNYGTGVLFLFVPVVVAALLALAGGAVYGVINGTVVKFYLLWVVVCFVENLFFFSMAVCVLMFVGNIIAVPALYLILNFLYEGCLMIAEAMINMVCYGLGSYSLRQNGIGVLTPIIYLRRVGIDVYRGDYSYSLNRIHALPGYFVAAVLFAVIAMVAYQKKHIETAGDVITVGWLKPIFRWGAAVCTSALGAVFISSIFYTKSFLLIISCVVVIGVIIFFAAQMLLERSVHIFTKRKIRECVIYTVMICACYIALDMDIAGLEKKLPAADEIKMVQMHGAVELLTESETEISWARDLHSQIIASRKNLKRLAENDRQSTVYLSMEYLLKDDSVLKRTYELPNQEAGTSILEQLQAFEQQTDVQLKQLFGIHYPQITIFGGKWELPRSDGSIQDIRVSEADAKQLYEAVVEDVCSGRVDEDSQESAGMMDTNEIVGELTLSIRDEAGFMNVLDYRSIDAYKKGGLSKEGSTFIHVDKRFSSLLEKMEELGYLSEDTQ